MPDPRADRALAWLHALTRERADEELRTPVGLAVRHPELGDAHDHNLLLLAPDADPAAVAQAADLALAGLAHRVIEAPWALADALEHKLEGYDRSDELVMAWAGTEPEAEADVVVLGAAERAAVAARDWQEAVPAWPAALCTQLGDRVRTLPPGLATHLALRDPAGDVLARVDLFARAGVAQVEELVTVPKARGAGLGSALVREAVRRGLENGAELVLLVVDADDGPQALYTSLGFAPLACRAIFTSAGRAPSS